MPNIRGARTSHRGDQPLVFLAMSTARAMVSPSRTAPEVGRAQPQPMWAGGGPKGSVGGVSGDWFTRGQSMVRPVAEVTALW